MTTPKLPPIPRLSNIFDLPQINLPSLPPIPQIPTVSMPSSLTVSMPSLQDITNAYQKNMEERKIKREASRLYFEDDVSVGDLFVIKNNDREFMHCVVSIHHDLDNGGFTNDRLIKVFSFSRNCIIQFYRGPAYQDTWSGSFSEFDFNFSYNYAYLPLETKVICKK